MGGEVRPQVPEPGQQHTVYDATSSRNELLAAEAASQWTAEQYAHFTAELQAAGPHGDAVFGRYGLNSSETREIVMEGWARRLEEEPALRARFDAVLAERQKR